MYWNINFVSLLVHQSALVCFCSLHSMGHIGREYDLLDLASQDTFEKLFVLEKEQVYISIHPTINGSLTVVGEKENVLERRAIFANLSG